MAQLHHSRAIFAAFMLLLGGLVPALAQSPMALLVTASASSSEPLELSLADLDAMEQVTFRTTTIWTDGEVTFSGVPLASVLAGLDGASVEMVALNDYKVVMPMEAVQATAPIVATRMDGAPMSVRDKGPYWVVFPYDEGPEYQTETIYSYSIWQLNRLRVIE